MYDVIVIGTGGVGSAALFHLARRGLKALGIDRFPPGHDRGSSHGETRIIRQAYFEHPDYVPLLRRTYELWNEVEQLRGQQLFFPVGLLEVGPPQGVVVPGVLESARRYGVKVESLPASEVGRRFPGFRVPDGCDAVFEPDAGYLLVEECVRSHAALAVQHGAEISTGETVVGWKAQPDGVEVITDRQRYHAARLVISAGAWARDLLLQLEVRLRVLRKHLYWLAAAADTLRADRGAPTFLFELPQGVFYGFPALQPGEVKVSEHTGGAEVADPLHDGRDVDPADYERVADFATTHLAGLTRRIVRHAVCFYTMSPDEHFIVGRHPLVPQVSLVAGLSGHGFKFVPVLGEILADLTIDGCTSQPIEFLSVERFP